MSPQPVNDKLKPPRCEACGGAGGALEVVRRYNKYSLWCCPVCNFQIWWPLGQAPREYFEQSYASFADTAHPPTLEARHKMLLDCLPIARGSVLDVGCDDSLMLLELQKKGFGVWGIDFNLRVIEKDKALIGISNLYPISIYDVVSLKNVPKFDLISFFELLEHIEDPKRFISTIRGLLKNDGYIALSIPDSKMFGLWDFTSNIPPYHTTYWTPKSLVVFLVTHGFEVKLMRKIERPDVLVLVANILMRLGIIKRNPITIASSANTPAPAASSQKTKLKKIIKKTLFVISLPLREFLYFVGSRPTIFVIAQ